MPCLIFRRRKSEHSHFVFSRFIDFFRKNAWGYALAVLVTLVVVGLRIALQDALDSVAPAIPFVIPIIIAGWYGGLGPGLVATALSVMANLGLYRAYRPHIQMLSQALPAGFVFACGVVLSWLCHRLHVTRSWLEQHRQELEKSRYFLSLITELTADFAWMAHIEPEGQLRNIAITEGFSKLLGYSIEEVQNGQAWHVLIHPDDLQMAQAQVKRAMDGEDAEGELRYITKSGRIVWVRYMTRPVRDELGNITGLIGASRNIDEQKRATDAARHLQEQLQLIIDSLPVLISYIDQQGRYCITSRAHEDWFGKPRSEITGQLVRDIIGPSAWDIMGPKLELVLAGTPVHYEALVTFAGAGQRWVEASCIPHRDNQGQVVGMVNLISDVSERKNIEETLRRERELLARIIDVIPVMFIIQEPSKQVPRVNREFERITGWTAQDAVEMSLAERCLPELEDREQFLKLMLVSNESWTDLRMKTKEGRDIDTAWAFIRILDQTQVAIGIDISSRKEYERVLKEADRRKDEFLAMLAHELRNPLAPIRNAVQILRAKPLSDPEIAWSRDVIDRQVQQMARLLEDLLDISRISRSTLQLRRQYVELRPILENAIETSRPLIDAGRHQLTISLPQRPIYLNADAVRLSQVFSNLLNNAAKYTDQGGHIWLVAERRDSKVVVAVKDTGVGIAEAMLPHIFKIFSQAASTLGRSQGGLGIGLSLVQGIVALHGGRIEAFSGGIGTGSEFVVHLPLIEDLSLRELGPASASDVTSNVAKERFLIVDDNVDNADSLATMLRILGAKVRTSYDGEDALAAAEEYQPSVVLLDIGMPKLNGYEVARRLRSLPSGREMLLIALTGWGQEEDRRRSKDAGFDYHMVKPIEFAQLLRLLSVPRCPKAPAGS